MLRRAHALVLQHVDVSVHLSVIRVQDTGTYRPRSLQFTWNLGWWWMAREGKEVSLPGIVKTQILTCHRSINRLNFYIFIYLFIDALRKYLLNAYYIPGSILGSGNQW